MPHAHRRFSHALEVSKLLVVAASYIPYAVVDKAKILGSDRWVVFGIGLYLTVALFMRNLTGIDRRIPTWAKWLWLAADFAAWWYSQALTHWSTGTLYPGLMLMADATMHGWERGRGVVPFMLTSGLISAGPLMITDPVGRSWVEYIAVMLPGYLFVYGLTYMAGRMSEEREEANRARTEAELANAHLRDYASQVEELAILRERNRVAREVHDTVAHGFTGMIMQLEWVTRIVRKSPEQSEEALLLIQEQARASLAEVRRSVHALRPLQMEERKGVAALQRLVDEFGSTTGVAADLVVDGLPVELPAGHDLCLYRTAQEGLTNAFRHGRASRARLRLQFSPQAVVLAIEDNGRTPPSAYKPGLGIVGIRERAQVLGGKVEAGAASTGGFVLQLTLPLSQSSGGAATA